MVHLRAVHMHEKPYECDICGQKFPRSSSMTRHRKRQSPAWEGDYMYVIVSIDYTFFKLTSINKNKKAGWEFEMIFVLLIYI